MMDDFPIFKSNSLLLRQIAETDLENVFRGLSHPEIIKYYGVYFTCLEETKKQMTWFADLEKNETGIWWAICSLDNTQFYGAVGLYFWSKQHKKAEIGFWLLPDFWGNGIVVEAIPFIMNYGFNHMNLHRIEAQVETENSNSRRVLEKLHFDKEGTMKDCEIKNGRFISLDMYAILHRTHL